jgi:hypothetical protein
MQPAGDDRSLADLFAELARETGTLVRQEVGLAVTELTDKGSRLGKEVVGLAVGAAVAYAGLLALIAGVILALGEAGLPWWLSALLVGAAVAGVGYLLINRARASLKRADLLPRQAVESLRQDVELVKEQVGS